MRPVLSFDHNEFEHQLAAWQRGLKRGFDVVVAAAVLGALGWLIPLAAVAARVSTGGTGLFRQVRIGRHGRPFVIVKVRTMRADDDEGSTVTTAQDPRITTFGRFLRRTKLDELPQFLNVLAGDMSLVGPRPDAPGFADRLENADRLVLSVRPGITGPATLVFRDEETSLLHQADPEHYNREAVWPTKVRINRRYVEQWRFRDDLRYLWLTVLGRTLPLDEVLG